MDSTLKNKMNRNVRVKNKAGKNSPLYKDNVEKRAFQCFKRCCIYKVINYSAKRDTLK